MYKQSAIICLKCVLHYNHTRNKIIAGRGNTSNTKYVTHKQLTLKNDVNYRKLLI